MIMIDMEILEIQIVFILTQIAMMIQVMILLDVQVLQAIAMRIQENVQFA